MDVELVERMLRALPGVLDCSVNDEGIAVVVHPEVDPRLLELRAQAALAEIGEHRPLLVVGGMSAAALGAPVGGRLPRGVHRMARNRSSMPVIGFAVLVVAALTVLPLASRDAPTSDDGAPEVAAPAPPGRPAPARSSGVPSFESLPITGERMVAALAPTFVRPLGPATATAATGFVRRAATPVVGGPVPGPPALPVPTAVDVGAATPVVPTPVVFGTPGTGDGRGKKLAATSARGSSKAGRLVAAASPDTSGKAGKDAKAEKAPKAGKGVGRR